MEILLDIQDIEKRFRMGTNMCAFPRARIVEHFSNNGMKQKFDLFVQSIIFVFSACLSDFDKVTREQILDYVEAPILYKSSYGILLYNSKREVYKTFFTFIHNKILIKLSEKIHRYLYFSSHDMSKIMQNRTHPSLILLNFFIRALCGTHIFYEVKQRV